MAKFSMSGGLDAWLERRGIKHPLIMPVIRNQILILLCAIFAGSAAGGETLWGIWFSVGFGLMTYILFSWARFFLRNPFGNFGMMVMRAVLLHFFLRLVLLAVALYAALVWGHAQPLPLLTGIAAGTMAPLLTVAWARCSQHRK